MIFYEAFLSSRYYNILFFFENLYESFAVGAIGWSTTKQQPRPKSIKRTVLYDVSKQEISVFKKKSLTKNLYFFSCFGDEKSYLYIKSGEHMVAVYIDPVVEKYIRQVKFTLGYMLSVLGYSWKYIDPDNALSPNDIVIYYSPTLPDQSVIDLMMSKFTFIFIPFNKELYIPGHYSGDHLKYNLKTFKYIDDIPFICSKRTHKIPIQLYEENGSKYCVLEFDIIGNLFFHMSEDNRTHLKKKDKNENLILNDLGFYDFFQTPYVNHLINMLSYTLKELIEYKNIWNIRVCMWPENQPFAAVISHNLDKTQKWSIGTIILSLFEFAYLFFTLRLNIIYKNVVSIIKYMFSNIENYWNIGEITNIETKHKFKSTWFVRVNQDKKSSYDYNFDDEEILKELHNVVKHGSEVALLHESKEHSIDDIKKEYDYLISKIRIKKAGIRHVNNFGEIGDLDKLQHEIGIKFDSSRRLKDKNAFYNGFALPYPIYTNLLTSNQNIIQFPITFTDELLKIDKYKYIPHTHAMAHIKEMISIVKKVNGMISIQLSNSLFHDIHYMPSLLGYIVDNLKEQNAFVTSCSEMVEWLDKKKQVIITEGEDKVSIKFLDNINQITFEIVGKKIISTVLGGNHNFNEKIVHIYGATKDLIVEINLINIDSE